MSDIDPDDAGIARVLRAAGGRAQPDDEMKAAVRAAVHAEWRTTVARHGRRRVYLALAASVAMAALAVWVGRAYFVPSNEVVANVSRIIGTAQVRSGRLGSWHVVAAPLHTGETLMTGADGRVALQLHDGVSVRLDHDTRVAFVDPGQIDVKSGAVYVDAGTVPTATDHLRVGTPAGVVQHVGTQYEARIVAGGTRIRVREGRVDLLPENGGTTQTASVGEQLLVSASGDIQRDSISPSDDAWSWAADTAPPFDINGRPVREFLTWVGRELGREIVYATPAAEAEADRAVLSGSVTGLAPADALAAVLPTTQLRSVERDGKIEITLQ
jgi:ferric-dicitrate binding protein FerR (iron transport regulator)